MKYTGQVVKLELTEENAVMAEITYTFRTPCDNGPDYFNLATTKLPVPRTTKLGDSLSITVE